MARIRSIKLDLFMDDGLAEVSLEAHFLLAGLPCIADSAGRLEDRPRRIQAQIFPYRSVNVDACLDELAQSGHVCRYEAEGIRYIQVINWDSDQRPHVKEPASEIPPPTDSTEPRQSSDVAGKSPVQKRWGVGSGVLDLGSGVSPPASPAAPREELRLESQETPRRTRRKEPAPTDPRHAPLVKALVEEIGFPFDGGKDAQNVKALLALADQQPATSGDAAPAEILRRARIARGQHGFNSARTLGDFRAHWGRFEAPEQHRAGPAPPSDFSRPPAVPPRSEFAPDVSDEPF